MFKIKWIYKEKGRNNLAKRDGRRNKKKLLADEKIVKTEIHRNLS